MINRIINKNKNKNQNDIFDEFRIKNLCINSSNNNINYDTCVIGSDEVFNCSTNAEWGFTSQLFGNVKNAKEVITYAASCGSTKIENINLQTKEKIEESMRKLKAISVRDSNTYNFVREILSTSNISYNLDPVLVGDFNNDLMQVKPFKLPKKFCIVYSYYNRINSKEEIQIIKKFCKKNKMEIVSIGAPQFWIKNHLVLDPFEMLYAFSKADFIITDTFHGTIFAAKYAEKLLIIVRNSNSNKLLDLIDRLKLNNHLCTNISEIETIYSQKIERQVINSILEIERTKTKEYLKKNI